MASGGSRRVPISRPGRDPLAGADVEAELLVHLDVLTSHGFPTATWNVEAIHRLPMTVARFIQTVRIITSVTDPAQRGNIVALGVVSEFYTEAMTCTLRTLVAFCEYLRTPGGQDALRSRQYRSRLERQGGGQRSVAAVALLTAAQHQRGDLSIEQKKVRADYEAKIAELQRQMATLRAEEKEKLEGVARQFRPVGEYKDLVGPSFTNRCIAAYYDQCRELGVAARPMTESEIANVEAKYGPAVKDDHLLEFIQDSSRTRRLLKWVNRKIRFFDRHFNVRRAGLFRQLVAAAGGAANAEIPPELQGPVAEGHSGGEDSTPAGPSDQLASDLRDAGYTSGNAEDAGTADEATTPTKKRDRSQSRKSSKRKPKTRGQARAEAEQRTGHPSQPQ
ncbi:TPA_asm: hypothetical protein [Bletilla striata amalgavirus 1]|nr:putative coat protein [Bletilla amalgavirus 1]DAZ90994.1 TPA_asm: hypothetical protein [Bletilla striata amalgavirus 1]